MVQDLDISVMHATQLTLSLTCLIMHYNSDKWNYEFQFDPLFSLTFVGCTVTLLAIIILELLRSADACNRGRIGRMQVHHFSRAETIFDVVAFFMFVTCGIICVVYDDRPEPVVKGILSMINGMCFLLDAVVRNPCQYRWGEALNGDYEPRLDERRSFYHLATYYHAPTQINS